MNTKRITIGGILLAIVITVLLSCSVRANADVNSELGPVATTYTVKGVSGTKATGFYVRYHNGVVKILPAIKTRLKDADDGAERYMIKHRYQKLADLKHKLNKFHANQVF